MENTQFALVATVHKLYAMVRSANAWDLGEPELNERGQPVIHSIASKLGCIRPNNDPDLPMGSSAIPETEQDLSELASQLEEHQKKRDAEQAAAAAAAIADAAAAQAESSAQQSLAKAPAATTTTKHKTTTATTNPIPITMSTSLPTATMLASNTSTTDLLMSGSYDRASSSEDFDGPSDMDDYRKIVFGNGNGNTSSVNSASTTMSPQSLNFNDFDVGSTQSDGFVAPSPTLPTMQYANWMTQTAPVDIDMSTPSLQQTQAQAQFLQLQLQQQQLQLQQQQQRQQQQRQLQQRQLQQQQMQQQRQNFKQVPLSLSIPTSMAAASMPMLGSNPTLYSADLLRQGLLESNFGAMEPHIMSSETPDGMLGMGDPMFYDGDYDENML